MINACYKRKNYCIVIEISINFTISLNNILIFTLNIKHFFIYI